MRYPGDDFIYVLNAGVPALPSSVGGGRRVPVTATVGDRFAAVMVVEEDPHFPGDLYGRVYTYRRITDGWESSNGSGGFDWPGGLSSCAVSGLGEREVFAEAGRTGSDIWGCELVQGFVGSAGWAIEVHDESGVTRRGIDPSHAFVVIRQGDQPAVVRVLDRGDGVLADWEL